MDTCVFIIRYPQSPRPLFEPYMRDASKGSLCARSLRKVCGIPKGANKISLRFFKKDPYLIHQANIPGRSKLFAIKKPYFAEVYRSTFPQPLASKVREFGGALEMEFSRWLARMHNRGYRYGYITWKR